MTKKQIEAELEIARKAVNAIDMKAADWEAQWDARMVRVRELRGALSAMEAAPRREYTSREGDVWSVGDSYLKPGMEIPA